MLDTNMSAFGVASIALPLLTVLFFLIVWFFFEPGERAGQ